MLYRLLKKRDLGVSRLYLPLHIRDKVRQVILQFCKNKTFHAQLFIIAVFGGNPREIITAYIK